ncbi:MAG: gp53-like domain-containing protein, partial [Cetobacterium somerae]
PAHLRQVLHKWQGGIRWREKYAGNFQDVPWTYVFDTQNCPISKADNGWCKLANGLIIQWGYINKDFTLHATVNFGIPFTAVPKIIIPQFSENAYVCFGGVWDIAPNAFTFGDAFKISSTGGTVVPNGRPESISYRWIAIGF